MFETPHHKIAEVAGKTPAAVGQIAHRPLEHLAARRPRMQVDRAFAATTAWLNGMPGARIDLGGAATAVSLVAEDGRITRIYAVRNPRKLGRLEKVAELRR